MTMQTTVGLTMFTRALRLPMVLLTVLLAMFVSNAAQAQGTGGSLPDPMSSHDLDKIMDRLHLDEAQRRATETYHEQYLESFKQLREGEIEKFMEAQRSMQGSMPQRKQLEDFLGDMDRLHSRIAHLDDQFFDQIMPLLRDDQQITLTRARMYRARERLGGDMAQMIGFLIPAASIDLSEMYGRLRLSPDEQLMIQSVVMEYESKLTRLRREIFESTTHMFLDAFTMLEENGVTQETFEDPEKAQEALKVMREAWATLSQKVMAKGMEASNLNRRTCKRLADMMPGEHGNRLTDMYYSKAYPELPTSNLDGLFKKSLRYKDLTDEQFASISVLEDEFRRQQRNLFDDMADIQDQLRATKSPFDFGGMGGEAPPENDEAVDKLADLTERHTKLTERMTDALNATLGADLQAKITQAPDVENDFGADGDAAAGEGGATAADMTEVVEAQPQNNTADQPISVADFKQYMAELNLDEATQAVAEQLHAAYVDRFKKVSEEVQGKVAEAQSNMWHYDAATSTTSGPTTDQVDKVYDLRKSAETALRDVDAQFFRDLALTCGTDPANQERVESIRMMRERDSLGDVSNSWSWNMGNERSEVARIDLVELCMDQRLLDDASGGVRSAISSYQSSMGQAMQARHEESFNVQRSLERSSAERYANNAARRGQDGENFDMAEEMRIQNTLEAANKKLADATKKVVAINEETLKTLQAALPEDQASRLEKAFKRKAFPTVYQDAEMMEQTYAKMRSLNSLSPTQHDKLDSLLSTHEEKDEALREKMIAVLSDAKASATPFARNDWRDYQRVQNAMAKLKFERDELLARTRRRVQDVLSDDQLAQVGGPFARQASPEPADDPDMR